MTMDKKREVYLFNELINDWKINDSNSINSPQVNMRFDQIK